MIRASGLCKRWGAVTAVDDLSFELLEGETLAVIGPNGAGKTTTLKCVLGLVRPDAGRIALGREGLAPSDPRARAAVGYVPQRVEFPAERTAAQVLGFYSELRGLGRAAVGAALTRVGMDGMADRRASELSGGFIQRLSLAQALLGDPELLVLDEPTASLDPQATWEFRSLVLDLKARGKSMLLCSHLLAEVERVADRVLILIGGRAVALERMEDLRLRQLGATRLVIELNGATAAASELLAMRGMAVEPAGAGRISVSAERSGHLAALDALRAAGVLVRGFELQRPTLEELFMAAVRAGEPGAGR